MAENPDAVKAFGGDSAPGTATASKTEVAMSPGAFAGKSQDPCEATIPHQATRVFGSGEYSGPMVFADWYRAEPEPAMAWFRQVYGSSLNLAALSENQRKRMGL
jgi:hypothetical protein